MSNWLKIRICIFAVRRGTHQLPFPLQVPRFKLLDLGLEALRLPGVFGQHVHQIRDVARGEAQRLDFGQFGVRGHVGDALPQLREGRVDALRPPALLLGPRRPPLPHPRREPLQPAVVRGPRRPQLRGRVGRLDLEVRRDLAVVHHPALEVRRVLVAPLHEREGLVHQVVVMLVAPDQVHGEPSRRSSRSRSPSLRRCAPTKRIQTRRILWIHAPNRRALHAEGAARRGGTGRKQRHYSRRKRLRCAGVLRGRRRCPEEAAVIRRRNLTPLKVWGPRFIWIGCQRAEGAANGGQDGEESLQSNNMRRACVELQPPSRARREHISAWWCCARLFPQKHQNEKILVSFFIFILGGWNLCGDFARNLRTTCARAHLLQQELQFRGRIKSYLLFVLFILDYFKCWKMYILYTQCWKSRKM